VTEVSQLHGGSIPQTGRYVSSNGNKFRFNMFTSTFYINIPPHEHIIEKNAFMS
jgi:hypothetical protein